MKCSCIIFKIVSKSINKLKCIYRNNKGFNWQIQIMISLAMVQCHYDYAYAMWFSRISISAEKQLQIVLKKIIRFVLGIPPRMHLGCRGFSRVNILPGKYRVYQIKLNHMFNIVHGSGSEYLKGFGIKSFFYSASKLWNSLSPNLLYITYKHVFQKEC